MFCCKKTLRISKKCCIPAEERVMKHYYYLRKQLKNYRPRSLFRILRDLKISWCVQQLKNYRLRVTDTIKKDFNMICNCLSILDKTTSYVVFKSMIGKFMTYLIYTTANSLEQITAH